MSMENGRKNGAMSVKKWSFLCLVLYLFFVIVRLPADRFWPEVLRRSGLSVTQVLLTGGEGIWLAGSFRKLSVSGVDVGSLHWRIKPWYVLVGAVRCALDLKMADGQLRGDVGLTPWSVGAYDLNGEVPLEIIRKMTGSFGIELAGSFQCAGLDTTLKKGLPDSAEGKILWRQAGIKQPYDLKVGDLEAVITTDPEGIKINVSDKGGALMARVSGTVKQDGTFGINGEFAPRESADPDLVSFLKIMGEPGSDGRVRLSHRGNVKDFIQ